MEFHHIFVVSVGDASYGGYVDNHNAFLAVSKLCEWVYRVAVDVLCT